MLSGGGVVVLSGGGGRVGAVRGGRVVQSGGWWCPGEGVAVQGGVCCLQGDAVLRVLSREGLLARPGTLCCP